MPYEPEYGLYDGPIDGWFSVFHRSVLPLAQERYGDIYFPLGAMLRNRLREIGRLGLLCTKFKVFHVVGPQYASHFGMLDFEIEKYRRLGRHEIVSWYESAKDKLPPPEELSSRVKKFSRTWNNDECRNTTGAELPARGSIDTEANQGIVCA